jgi:4-amino-4-deoxy-L-arabinose transferase-like glycosyltransferase
VLAGLALPAVWRDRRQAAIKFLLAWIIPAWVVFELVVTKLPHYVLPLYPAIAILIAGKLAPPDLSQRAWLRRGSFWWFAIPLVLGFGSIAALLAILGDPQFLVWPFVIAAVTAGFLAWRRYDIEGPERSFLRAVAAAVLLAVALYGVMFPSLDKLFPSPKLAEAVRLSGCANPSVALAGYHEPSAVFLIGTATQLTDGAGAAEFLHRPVCGVALIEARQEAAFLRRAGEIGLRYSRGASVDGFNISSGRTVSIAVFRTGERS